MLIEQVLNQPAPSVRAINGTLSVQLEEIVLKSLEKSPDQRYQRAVDFENPLRRLTLGLHRNPRPLNKRPIAAYRWPCWPVWQWLLRQRGV